MNYLACLMWGAIIVLLVFLSLYGPVQEQEQDTEKEKQAYMEFLSDLRECCPECQFTEREAVKLFDVSRYCKREQVEA